MNLSKPAFDQILEADPLERNLGAKSAAAGRACIISQAVQFAVALGSTMILGRLLTPEAFGIRDMLAVVLAFFRSFQDFGLPYAISHARAIDRAGIDRLFWKHAALSVLTACLIAACGVPLSYWFRAPPMATLMPIMGGCAFAVCLATVPRGLMIRQMRHGELAVVDVLALVVAIIAAIGLGLAGAGHWALVAEIGMFQVVSAIGQWWVAGWIPGTPFRSVSSRGDLSESESSLIKYSAGATLERLVVHAGRNFDCYLIGRIGGAIEIGLYGLATRWALMPMRQAYLPLLSVAVSGLSRVQDSPDRFRGYFRRGLAPVFLLTMPLLGLMASRPETIIRFVVGEQWVEASLYFQLLAIAAMFEGVHRVSKLLYLSQGNTDQQLRWGAMYTAFMLVCVLVGAVWGVDGVVLGFLIGTVLVTPVAIVYCTQSSHVRPADFVSILWRPITATSVATLALGLFPMADDRFGPWGTLPIVTGLYLAIYGIVCILLPGSGADVKNIWQLISPTMHHKTTTEDAIRKPNQPPVDGANTSEEPAKDIICCDGSSKIG